MNTIKIYFEDIEDVKNDFSGQVRIKINFDPAWYFCDEKYYNASMADRGFVQIQYED